jgi:predicted RNA-binding protein with RPS1 domain
MPGSHFFSPNEIDATLVIAETNSQNINLKIRELITHMQMILGKKEQLLKQKANAISRDIEINQPIDLQDVLRKLASHTDMLSRIAYRVVPSLPQPQIEKIQKLDDEYALRAAELNLAMLQYNQAEEMRHWLMLAKKLPDKYCVQNAIYEYPKAPTGFEWNAVVNIGGVLFLLLEEIVKELPTEEEKAKQEFTEQERAEQNRLARVRKKAIPIWQQFDKDVNKEGAVVLAEMKAGIIPYDEDKKWGVAMDAVQKRYGYKSYPPDPWDKEKGKKRVNPRFAEFYDEVFKKQEMEKKARKEEIKKSKKTKAKTK